MSKKTISFYHQKNGTGKTTLAYTLARQLGAEFLEITPTCTGKDGFIKTQTDTSNRKVVIDINTDSEYHIKKSIESSDHVLIPTDLDFKVLTKTADTIKEVSLINPKAVIVVIFNRLSPDKKDKELAYTEAAQDYLKELDIPFKVSYVRENKLWYREFNQDKFYLDHILKEDCFLYFAKDIKGMDEYFSNNQLLEVLYQYSYFYTLYYMRVQKKFGDDKESLIKALQAAPKRKNIEFKANSHKTAYNALLAINKEFVQLRKTMTSFDYDLFDLVKQSSINLDTFNNEIKKLFIETYFDNFENEVTEVPKVVPFNKQTYRNNVILNKEILEKSNVNSIDELFDLEEKAEPSLNLIYKIELRESMVYSFLRCFIDFRESNGNRQLLRDLRNLVFIIGEK